jgi:hypothetical protein
VEPGLNAARAPGLRMRWLMEWGRVPAQYGAPPAPALPAVPPVEPVPPAVPPPIVPPVEPIDPLELVPGAPIDDPVPAAPLPASEVPLVPLAALFCCWADCSLELGDAAVPPVVG